MTARSPLWAAEMLTLSVAIIGIPLWIRLVLVAIGGTDKDEAHPVLAVKGWVTGREAALMAWWQARRWPVAGLLWPQKGKHQAKEAGDGAQVPWPGMRGTDSTGDAGLPPPLVPGAEGAEERGLRGVAGSAGSASAPGSDDARDQAHEAAGKDDDLTTGDDYDTDTLAIFAAAREERLVPSHEPAATVHMSPQDGDGGLMPCCGDTPFERPSDRMTLDPALVTCTSDSEASAPAHTGCGDDPGPDGLAGATPPALAAAVASGPGTEPARQPGGGDARTELDAARFGGVTTARAWVEQYLAAEPWPATP